MKTTKNTLVKDAAVGSSGRKRYLIVYPFFLLALGALALGMHNSGAAAPKDLGEYMRDLVEADAGLVRSRIVNDVEFEVRYLPPELLAYRELRKLRSAGHVKFDSLCAMYSGTNAFELRFRSTPPNEGRDVMYKGITSEEEYKDRVMTLNFDMPDLLRLKVENDIYMPGLALAENTYSLKPERVVLALFSDENLSASLGRGENVRFQFSDEIFFSGLHNFTFEGQALLHVPEFPRDDALGRLGQK